MEIWWNSLVQSERKTGEENDDQHLKLRTSWLHLPNWISTMLKIHFDNLVVYYINADNIYDQSIMMTESEGIYI